MKKQKLPNIVSIAILTVITVFFWIGLDLYRALTIAPPPTVSPAVLAKLDPSLDQESLDKLQQRVYNQSSTSSTTVLRVPEGVDDLTTPTPSVVPLPTSSPVATASASP